MKIINVTEEVVSVLASMILMSEEYNLFCQNDDCLNKVIATTLNNLPTYYVANNTDRDIAFLKFKNQEFLDEINNEIIKAIYLINRCK